MYHDKLVIVKNLKTNKSHQIQHMHIKNPKEYSYSLDRGSV